MEINKCSSNSAISKYKINSSSSNAANNSDAVKKDVNTSVSVVKNVDKVEFSYASRSKNSAVNAKNDVRREVESFASPERINNLKNMIKDGNYNIPAEAVAASIFEG